MRPSTPHGLCDDCRHQRIVRNTRGSVFSLCQRSKSDPAFPRYPRVPVLACRGHEPESSEPEPGRPPGVGAAVSATGPGKGSAPAPGGMEPRRT